MRGFCMTYTKIGAKRDFSAASGSTRRYTNDDTIYAMSYPEISHDDWERMRELAAKLVGLSDAEDEVEEKLTRSQILAYLDDLDEKYGPHPKIYDSIGDFLPVGQDPLPWKLRAYEICAEDDLHEKILISTSICQHYIEDRPDEAKAEYWHEKLLRHCYRMNDRNEIDSALELKKEIEGRFDKK
jgi:hypothetical protein